MTDSNYTHLKVVADRSGSMSMGGAHKEMASALESFFAEQAELDGKCLVDYAQFDSEYEQVYEDMPADAAKALIVPRGATALLDAIGKATTELGAKLAALPENKRPSKVLVVVVTDGYENASREWNGEAVKNLIQTQESQWNWEYVFLGANIDAVAVGQQFGFKGGSSLTFDTENTNVAMASVSAYTTTYRGGSAPASFTDDDRKKAVKKK